MSAVGAGRRWVMAGLVALCPWSGLGAQADSAIGAAAVARAVLEADSSGNWPVLLRLAHPDAVREFRALQVLRLRMMGDTARRPADSLAEGADSAEQRRFIERRARRQRAELDSIFRVPDVDALARLPPDSVFARWMRARPGAEPGAEVVVPRSHARLVGVLPADDTLAYAVVVRGIPKLPGPMPEHFRDLPRPEESPVVMVLRRMNGEWRSMLNGLLLTEAVIGEDLPSGE